MMADPGHEGSAKTWLVIIVLLLIVGFQGALSYFLVGDRGQPDWDFRPIKDVPGESPYAVYEYFPFPQHVRGGNADYPPLEQEWGFPYAVYKHDPGAQAAKGDAVDKPPMETEWDKSMFPAPQQNAEGR